MAKIKINKLPQGFSIRNGKVVEDNIMRDGGMTTGDQADYGLVTTPQEYYGQTSFNNSRDESVRYSLSGVPREDANIEAEGGETVLTDLNNDGTFGLYDIKGPRHGSGGVPMFLPEQSFVFSDTRKLKFTKDEMSEFDMGGSKKTPAKISKKFGLQDYYGELGSQYVDNISATSAELMLKKNMNDLSKLAFMQEAKKNFSDGVPLASHPYLVSIGEDPIEFTSKVEEISRKEAERKAIQALPLEQQQQIMMLQQMMAQQEQQQEMQQGMPEQGMPQQMPQQPMMGPMDAFMPPPGEPGLAMENNAMMNPTAQFGSELGDFLIKAQTGGDLVKGKTKGSEFYKGYYPETMEDPIWTGKSWIFEDGSQVAPNQLNDMISLVSTTGFVPEEYLKADAELEAVTTNETIDATDKQVDTVIASSGMKNPYAKGSKKAKEYDQYIKDGYTPTVVKRNNKNQISFVKKASSNFEQREGKVEIKTIDLTGTNAKGDAIYSQAEIDFANEMNESGIAYFDFGSFSGGNLPLRQNSTGNQNSWYGSDEFASEEAKEDWMRRNGKIAGKIKGFDYNKGKDDPQWKEFQKLYEEERKEFFKKIGKDYIPYFGSGTTGSDFDGKAGGKVFNAPGFDVDYQAGDERFMDLPDDVKVKAKEEFDIPSVTAKSQEDPEFWQQDINNLVSIGNMRDNLYLPFAPQLEDQKIDYVLDDYTGRVNANLASQNTMAQALGAYGPQAIAGSNIAGQTLAANAKSINQVNQNNVRTMNQVATMQPQLDMKIDQLNADTTTKLYDGTTIALQNKDNFYNWRNKAYTDAYNDALTNKSNTYNMNQLYDYYNINPSTGGIVEFTDDGRMLAKNSSGKQSQQKIENYQALKELMGDQEVPEWLYNQIYSTDPGNSGMTKAQQEMRNNGLNPNTRTAKEGKEVKRLSKWAVPFYSGKMGM